MTTRILTNLLLLASLGAGALTLDDIHYWVGEGANKCAVVIDWDNGDRALAWGYKWNGTCTNLAEVVRRIVHDDPRLVSDDALTFFGYDVNDVHPSWDKTAGTCSDPVALAAAGGWSFDGAVVPESGSCYTIRRGAGSGVEPIAAESPYGYQVVASSTREKSPMYSNPDVVLGRPTMGVFNTGGAHGDSGALITPAYPAWSGGRIYTAAGGTGKDEEGFVTIKFDHDVVDDPKNPWGIDFIVFGNAMAIKTGSSYVTLAGNPADVRFVGTGNEEPGVVSVSQDGRTWYTSEKWKTFDGAMPTLGYEYDDKTPDTGLFSNNQYWGRATRATFPVDPSCTFASFTGLTLTQACQRYRGSAGGVGYDLQYVDLPLNEQGLKWFRYVRIAGVCTAVSAGEDIYDEEGDYIGTSDGTYKYSEPEVDAVADVAPVSDYELWVERNYDWATAWDKGGAEVVAKNGLINALNFAWGLSPTASVAETVPFEIAGFETGDAVHTLTVRSPSPMSAAGGIVVQATDCLTAGWKTVVPTLTSSKRDGKAFVNTFTVPAGAGAFFKLVVPTE